MQKAILLISIFFSTQILFSQIENSAGKKQSKIISESVLIGEWISSTKKEYTIAKEENAFLKITETKKDKWSTLSRMDINVYSFTTEDGRTFELTISTKKSIDITVFDKEKQLDREEQWTKRVPLAINEGLDSTSEKSLFLLYYPSLNSPYALYAGLLNKKWNVYIGLRFSNFLLYSADGGPYESIGSTLDMPNNSGATYKEEETVGQTSITIGLSNELIKDRLLIHYGIGYGLSNTYKGFDLWDLDSNDNWEYDTSVWANDVEEEISGVQVEVGLILDVGVLISVGGNTLNFEKYDLMFGLGYAF